MIKLNQRDSTRYWLPTAIPIPPKRVNSSIPDLIFPLLVIISRFKFILWVLYYVRRFAFKPKVFLGLQLQSDRVNGHFKSYLTLQKCGWLAQLVKLFGYRNWAIRFIYSILSTLSRNIKLVVEWQCSWAEGLRDLEIWKCRYKQRLINRPIVYQHPP